MAYDLNRCPQTEDEFREYFYALIGRSMGSNAADYEAVLSKPYPWQGQTLMIPPGVGPGILQQPGAPFFGLTQQYSGGPKGRVFLPTNVPDDLGYFTRCMQYLDDAVGTRAALAKKKKGPHVQQLMAEDFATVKGALVWSFYWVAGHEYVPIQPAYDGGGEGTGGGGLTEAEVQAMIDDSIAQALEPLQAQIAGAVKLQDKIALRTNSGLLAGIKGGGPTAADAPIDWIGKTGVAHAWESLTIEKGE